MSCCCVDLIDPQVIHPFSPCLFVCLFVCWFVGSQDGLIETLRRTKPRFVYCFVPHHKAGLVDLSSTTFALGDETLHVPLLRSQVNVCFTTTLIVLLYDYIMDVEQVAIR